MDYNTNYERWLNHPAVDEAMKAELASMGEKKKKMPSIQMLNLGQLE